MTARGVEILSANCLAIGYTSSGQAATVMQDIDLSAKHGELVALIGRNGSGKSTLLRTLVSLQKPLNGSIYISGRHMEEIKSSELPRMISYASTEPFSVHNIRVKEVVALGRFPYTNWLGSMTEEDRRSVSEALEVTGLTALSERKIDNISDGERQRTLIARSLAQDTDLLIMDEPTAFLDLPARYEIVSLLRTLTREKGKCVVYSTHDLDTALNEADNIWLMSGKGINTGAPEDLILSKTIARAFESAQLSFSQATATFSFTREKAGDVALDAQGIAGKLTERALHRCGYSVKSTAEKRITVISKGNIYEWTLASGDARITFSGLYELMNHLLQQKTQ